MRSARQRALSRTSNNTQQGQNHSDRSGAMRMSKALGSCAVVAVALFALGFVSTPGAPLAILVGIGLRLGAAAMLGAARDRSRRLG